VRYCFCSSVFVTFLRCLFVSLFSAIETQRRRTMDSRIMPFSSPVAAAAIYA